MKTRLLIASMMVSALTFSASAEDNDAMCDLKVDGKVILNNQSCYVSIKAGSYEIDQGNFLSIVIPNGKEFRWNGSNPPAKTPDDPNRYNVKSLGSVKSQLINGGVCWDNKRVHFCYSH